MTLAAVYDLLREFHKSAPFLFFNGNTFSSIGRELSLAVFSDLPPARKRESASFAPGDRVQTLRGSTSGTVVRIHADGRIVWKPDGSGLELTGLPEGLKKQISSSSS